MTASQDQWPLTITLCQTFPAPASQAGGVSGDLGARWEEQRGWGTVCIYRFYMSGCTVCTVYILYIYIYMSQCQPGWRHDEARFSAGASCSFGLALFLHVRHEGTQLLEKKIHMYMYMYIYIYILLYVLYAAITGTGRTKHSIRFSHWHLINLNLSFGCLAFCWYPWHCLDATAGNRDICISC